jgi:hypothetical protein
MYFSLSFLRCTTKKRFTSSYHFRVKTLYYKPEGCRFDFRCRWYHRSFSLTSFRPHYGPGVNSSSNRNEYQERFLGDSGFRCAELTNLPLSCADCLEVWEPQPPGTLRASPGLHRICLTFTLSLYHLHIRNSLQLLNLKVRAR